MKKVLIIHAGGELENRRNSLVMHFLLGCCEFVLGKKRLLRISYAFTIFVLDYLLLPQCQMWIR